MTRKKTIRKRTEHTPVSVTLDCPGCNAVVAAPVCGSYSYLQEGPDIPTRFLLARCPSCNEPMVAVQENWGDWDNDYDFDQPKRYLPARTRVGASVPKSVAGAFDEAGRCFGTQAYTASAIMCRKGLEALVREHKVSAPNLAKGLAKMRDAGLIETRLYEWADTLRLAGNSAAHDVDGSVSREDAKDTLDFTGALIEYVFTFRDRFEEFKRRRSLKKPSS